TAPQRARLAQALRSDTTVAVIAKTEVGQTFTRPAGPGPTLTWHYSAKNVRDVAWAAAPNFIWDASGYAGVLIQSLYPPEANAGWARSTEYARHSIKHYSEKWLRYPYPTAINIGGPVGGMEYPMIVFCGHRAGDRAVPPTAAHLRRHDEVRRGIPRVHPPLGVQASDPRRFLPLDGGRPRRGSLVVLAWLVLPH